MQILRKDHGMLSNCSVSTARAAVWFGGEILFLVAIGAASLAAQEQQLRLEDPGSPSSNVTVPSSENLPLSPERRVDIQAAISKHDYTGAETMLLEDIDKDPRQPALFKFAASVFFLDGKYLNTAIALKKSEAIEPLDEKSRFTLALAYIVLKHDEWAQPELARLEQSAPKNPVFPYWLGRIDYDARRYESAVRRFQATLDLDPGFMRAYDNLALCYEALAEYDTAISTYQRALELNRKKLPPSPWPPLNLANLLIKMGRLEDARAYVQESLEADPHFAKAHYSMGILLEKERNDKQAIYELNQSLSFDANLAESYYALARIYARDGEKTKAQEARANFEKLRKQSTPPAVY